MDIKFTDGGDTDMFIGPLPSDGERPNRDPMGIHVGKKPYRCKKGHTWEVNEPFQVWVTDDPEYKSGPLCPYCYVDWFKAQFGAEQKPNES